MAVTQGQAEQAAWLLGAAEAPREIIGAPVPPVDRAGYDSQVAAMRSQLDEARFAAAWAEGRAMTIEEAVEYALQAEL